jgi:hypothetical protein
MSAATMGRLAIRIGKSGTECIAMQATDAGQVVVKYRFGTSNWLGNLDSNQDKQSQSLLCYRYTIPQWIAK